MNNPNAIREFLLDHEAQAVGVGPSLPTLEADLPPSGDQTEADLTESIQLSYELAPAQWRARALSEAPASADETPRRFVDGCHVGQPILCVFTRGSGRPIPIYLAQVGAVVLRYDGQQLTRTLSLVDRVLSLITDPFPWSQVEGFARACLEHPLLSVRLLPANDVNPAEVSFFDYEAAKNQASKRAQAEMENLERLAFAAGYDEPTLVDGPLDRVNAGRAALGPLCVGVVKQQAKQYLSPELMPILFGLRPGQRTPCFQIEHPRGRKDHSAPVVSWYLKLHAPALQAPNYGYVRVEVPQGQFEQQFRGDFGMIDRLSRWLVDARCRTDSYSRMPISLEPVVRAEDVLKPLFTPMPVLVNRFYRQANFFRGTER